MVKHVCLPFTADESEIAAGRDTLNKLHNGGLLGVLGERHLVNWFDGEAINQDGE